MNARTLPADVLESEMRSLRGRAEGGVSALTLYRALAYFERALSMSYAPRYALHQAAEIYQVGVGELAELLLAKLCECNRARAERATLDAADLEVDTYPRRFDLEKLPPAPRSEKAIDQPAKSEAMRKVWAERRRARVGGEA